MAIAAFNDALSQHFAHIPSGELACIAFESLRKLAIYLDEFEVRAVNDTDTVMSMFEECAIALLAAR